MRKILILYILFSVSISFAYCQSDVTTLTNKVSENISLITDRDLYISGEKVWFKAEGFIALDLPNTHLSNVLYVELFDEKQQSYVKEKFNVKHGIVSAMFTIPPELESGNYLLRAYTQYHRNSLPESFTSQYITIINPSVKLSEKQRVASTIEIYPEFGFLLSDMENKLVVDLQQLDDHTPSLVWLEDDQRNRLAELNISNGMGLFEFIPEKNVDYRIYKVEANDTLVKKLAEVQSQGIVMRTSKSNFNDQLDLQIINRQSPSLQLHVGIYSKHFNKTSEMEVGLEMGTNHFAIPEADLEAGYNYFILRNHRNEILSILSYYHFSEDVVEILIRPDQERYQRRSDVQLTLSSAESKVEDLDLSISVVKKGTLLGSEASLPSYLIQNPSFLASYLYSNPQLDFENNYEIAALLLKYNSQLAVNQELKSRLENFNYHIHWVPEIRDVSLSGYVRNKNTKEPIPNAEVYASVFKSTPQVHLYKTDARGFFIFSLNNLSETQDVFLSINNKTTNNEELELVVNKDFSSSYPIFHPAPFKMDSSQIPLVEELYINAQASSVFKTEVGTFPQPSLKLPFSFMNAEFSLDLDEYVDSPSLEVVFRELIPSVKLKREDDGFSLTVTDPVKKVAQKDPLIMVDYITIFDMNEVMAIRPSDIKQIDIYTTPFVLGNSQFNGVILITTKTDNFGGMKMPEESIFFEYKTIANSYHFDPPNYGVDSLRSRRHADFRNLLYWNANLKLKADKKLQFYTSDHCSEYEIIVRGYTKDGRRCFGRSSIEVVAGY